MAYLGDLSSLNTDDNTKTNYTNIQELTRAISRVNQKALFLEEVELEADLQDGYCYFVKTAGVGLTYNLPPVAESANMEVFIQKLTGASSVTVETAAIEEYIILPAALLSPSNSKDLDTAGDYLHLICDGSAWYAIGYFIA